MYILKSSKGETILQKEKLIDILLSHPYHSRYSLFQQYWYSGNDEPLLTYKVYRDDTLIMDFKEWICHNLHMDVLSACLKYEAFHAALTALRDAIHEARFRVICNTDGACERVYSGDTSEGIVKGLKNTVDLLRDEMERVINNCI